MRKPNHQYKLFQWDFALLDKDGNVLGYWDYYCYSGYKDAWDDLTKSQRDLLTHVRASQGKDGRKILFGMNAPEVLESYLELLDVFFGLYQKINRVDLIKEIITLNQYTIPLDMPVNVCYGSAAIIRYLWEDPRIVYNFIKLREKFPDENIGRLFLIAHSQSILPRGEIHQGHSFTPYAYGRDVWAHKDVDYPSVFATQLTTPIERGRFVDNFHGNTVPWINERKVMNTNNYVSYRDNKAEREARLLELLAA